MVASVDMGFTVWLFGNVLQGDWAKYEMVEYFLYVTNK